MDRRKFVLGSAALGASGLSAIKSATALDSNKNECLQPRTGKRDRPLFIATWPFGRPACEIAVQKIKAGGNGLDAIEAGIHVVEADVSNSSVGIGGFPNANGDVELDACIMSGPGHRCGSVASLQSVLHPISVARKVMESTPHVMLVGAGAKQFALENGFSETTLLTEEHKRKWQEWKRLQEKKSIDESNHDTIAMVGIDQNGDLFGGCSTSGWAYKLAGRVGDSPILGAGLYVDNHVGAAGATGLGENVMRFCGSFLVVEMMRAGHSPMDACKLAIERIAETAEMPISKLDINFIAINRAGDYGAAGTSSGFRYSYANSEKADVLDAHAMTDKKIGPEGGNIR